MPANVRRGIGRIRAVTFEEARAQFPVLERYAYLQAGSVGPLARRTLDAMRAALEDGMAHGRGSQAQFTKLLEEREALREELAALVGVGADHMALTASTTDGCNLVLGGLGLGPSAQIITTTDEHFGLIGPLHASGAEVIVVEPDPEQIEAAVTAHTRLIATSHVLWTTGAVLPVHELRAATGVPILVDGAQSVGVLEVDARALDYYTISGQKWLCGPDGTGALVVADPDSLRLSRPSYLSQASYERDGSFVAKDGAARFDPNVTPPSVVAGLRAALGAVPEWAYVRAFELADRFRVGLAVAGCDVVVPHEHATLVSWRVPAEESAELVAKVAAADVIIRDLPGRGLLRASVGWWSNEDDLERLLAAL
jgi:L-cysteine/cystine lyase